MDVTTLQNQLTSIRASDGELGQRLSELDAKLGVWLSVVEAGHSALLELARKVAPGAIPPEASIPLVPPAPPNAVEDSPSAGQAPPSAVQPPPPSLSEDEALLQTLDHETAQAIRVRRRLCGGSRSVQQLLEEYRAAQPHSPAQQESKPPPGRGWWRRKNE